jgi:hypothetical protein
MKKTPSCFNGLSVSTEASTFFHVRTRVWNYSFLLVCTGLLIALHTTHQLDSDEGLILHGAWSILNGRMLYTDFFEFVAPGSFYLIAILWKLFGAHYWIAKSIAIVAIALAALGIYRISELIIAEQQVTESRWATFFGPFVFCLYSGYWPAINHNTFNIALVVWGTYFVCRHILRRNLGDATMGGFICGVAVLFLQHRGAVLAAVALFAPYVFHRGGMTATNWKSTGIFAVGLLAPTAAMFLFWPPSVLFEHLVLFPATRYLEVNRVDLSLFGVVASFVALAVWLLRRSSSRIVWFLLALQIVFFVGALQRPDASHITPILFPLLALFPLLLNMASGASRPSRYFVVWIAAGLLMLNARVPMMMYQRASAPFFSEPSQHPGLRYVRENCTASPYIYAGPFLPGIYFETDKFNPTRYSVLLTKLSTDSQFLEALRDFETYRPHCMVTHYAMVEKFKYDKRNVLDEYISRNYQVAYNVDGLQVWTRSRPGQISTPE